MEGQDTQGQAGGGGTQNPGAASGGLIGTMKSTMPTINLGGTSDNTEGAGGEGGQEGQEGQSQSQQAKKWGGRFATPEDLEKEFSQLEVRYGESSSEGKRLHQTLEGTKAEIAKHKAELAALNERVRKNSSFKELSEQELQKLREESPAAYTDYVLAKRQRDQEEADFKTSQERQSQTRETEQREVSTAVRNRVMEMRANPNDYPHYRELEPVMEELLDMAPHLSGYKSSPDILYMAALGIASLNSRKAAAKAATDATKTAADKAKGQAGHIAPGAGGAGGSAGNGLDDVNREILAGAPKRFFPGK